MTTTGAEKKTPLTNALTSTDARAREDASPHITIHRVWPGGTRSKPDHQFMTSVVARSDVFMNARSPALADYN